MVRNRSGLDRIEKIVLVVALAMACMVGAIVYGRLAYKRSHPDMAAEFIHPAPLGPVATTATLQADQPTTPTEN